LAGSELDEFADDFWAGRGNHDFFYQQPLLRDDRRSRGRGSGHRSNFAGESDERVLK